MTSTIKFADGTTLKIISARENREIYDGADRETLCVYISPDTVTLDALNKLLNSVQNLKEITVTQNDTKTIYNDYCIKMRLSCEKEYSTDETVIIKLGRYTTVEKKLSELGVL